MRGGIRWAILLIMQNEQIVVNSERDWLQRESREWAGGPNIVSFITGLKSTCRKVSFDRNTTR